MILDKVLEFIFEKAGEKFVILTAEEVADGIGQNLSQEDLFNYFNSLRDRGVIQLKYNDGICFCCAVTNSGKEYLEKENLQVDNKCKIPYKMPYFLIFISAFLGGVLGGVILLFGMVF